MNRIICGTVIAGRGMYVELLQQELDKRALSIALIAHDLIDELEGRLSSANVQALIGNQS